MRRRKSSRRLDLLLLNLRPRARDPRVLRRVRADSSAPTTPAPPGTRLSNDPALWGRGWYFEKIAVDPIDADTVYVPNVAVNRTRDGGKTWVVLRGSPGGDDYHQAWINPADPNTMIVASDQGAVITRNARARDRAGHLDVVAQPADRTDIPPLGRLPLSVLGYWSAAGFGRHRDSIARKVRPSLDA